MNLSGSVWDKLSPVITMRPQKVFSGEVFSFNQRSRVRNVAVKPEGLVYYSAGLESFSPFRSALSLDLRGSV